MHEYYYTNEWLDKRKYRLIVSMWLIISIECQVICCCCCGQIWYYWISIRGSRRRSNICFFVCCKSERLAHLFIKGEISLSSRTFGNSRLRVYLDGCNNKFTFVTLSFDAVKLTIMLKRYISTINLSQYVKLHEPKSAGIIQLNRPAALNAINLEMFEYDCNLNYCGFNANRDA